MITQAILDVFKFIVTSALVGLPSLPDLPSGVIDAIDYMIDLISQIVGVISYLYTPTIFILMFTIVLAILSFDFIYKFVLWLLHKVRG